MSDLSGIHISITGDNNDSNLVLNSASASVSESAVTPDLSSLATSSAVAGVNTAVAGVNTAVAGVSTAVAGVSTAVATNKSDILEKLGTIEGADEIMKSLGDQIIKENYIARKIKGTPDNFKALKNKPAISFTFNSTATLKKVSAIQRQMAFGDATGKVIELSVLNSSYQEIYRRDIETTLSSNGSGGALLTDITVDPYGRNGNPSPIEWVFENALTNVKQIKLTVKEIHPFDRAAFLLASPSSDQINYFDYGSWNVGFVKISMFQDETTLIDESELTAAKGNHYAGYANGNSYEGSSLPVGFFDPDNAFDNVYDPSFGSYPLDVTDSNAYRCWSWCGYEVLNANKVGMAFKAAVDDRVSQHLDVDTKLCIEERYVIGERLFGDPQLFKFLKYKPSASVEFPESKKIIKTEVHSRQMAFLDAAVKTVRVRALDASGVEVYDNTLDTSVSAGTILSTTLANNSRGTEGISAPLIFELSGNEGITCKKLIYEILDVWRYEPPSSDASFLAPADSPDRVEIYKQYVNGNSWNFGFRQVSLYDDASTNPISDFTGYIFDENRTQRTKAVSRNRSFEYAFLSSNYYLWPGVVISNGIRSNTICASVNDEFGGERVANVPEDEFTLELKGKVLHKNLFNQNALADYYEVGNRIYVENQDTFNDADDSM